MTISTIEKSLLVAGSVLITGVFILGHGIGSYLGFGIECIFDGAVLAVIGWFTVVWLGKDLRESLIAEMGAEPV